MLCHSLKLACQQTVSRIFLSESEIFKRKGLHFVHLNCNSLLNKIDEIRQFVTDFKPHVICFSETKIDSSVQNSEVSIDGYSVIRRDRNRHGGGVACFVNNSIHFKVVPPPNEAQKWPNEILKLLNLLANSFQVLFKAKENMHPFPRYSLSKLGSFRRFATP